MFEKATGAPVITTSIAADCDEHLRVLHKQLLRVLKNKPSDIPPEVGMYLENFPSLLRHANYAKTYSAERLKIVRAFPVLSW